MGQGGSYASKYTADATLSSVAKTSEWYQLLCSEQVVRVDLDEFRDEYYTLNPFRHIYSVMFNDSVPRDCQLALLFPQHPQQKKRVLFTTSYSSLLKLGIEINKRVRASNQWTLYVVCGNRVFHLENISVNAYVVWCARVNQQNVNSHNNTIAAMMPAFIEMDGYGRIRSCVLLNPLCAEDSVIPLPLAHLTVLTPFHAPMFPCEARDDRAENEDDVHQREIVTLNENDALNKATESVESKTFSVPPIVPLVDSESDGD